MLPSAAANFDWDFRKKEKLIIQDASAGLYKENDIEGIFSKHGGLSGIAALIIYFRTKALDKIFVERISSALKSANLSSA